MTLKSIVYSFNYFNSLFSSSILVIIVDINDIHEKMIPIMSMLRSTGFNVTYALYGCICHVLYQNIYTHLTITCHFFFKDVLRKPVMKELNKPSETVALIADLSIRGLW